MKLVPRIVLPSENPRFQAAMAAIIRAVRRGDPLPTTTTTEPARVPRPPALPPTGRRVILADPGPSSALPPIARSRRVMLDEPLPPMVEDAGRAVFESAAGRIALRRYALAYRSHGEGSPEATAVLDRWVDDTADTFERPGTPYSKEVARRFAAVALVAAASLHDDGNERAAAGLHRQALGLAGDLADATRASFAVGQARPVTGARSVESPSLSLPTPNIDGH